MYSTSQQKDYPLENSNLGAARTFLDQIKLSNHIIYLTNDGWSWNLGDQLKDNKRLEQEQDINELFITQPIEIEGIKNSKVVKLQANRTVQIALTESGKVYVRGSDRNSTGILGLGEDVFEQKEFRQIAAFQNKKMKQISLGLSHAAAIDDSDNLYIWGSGSNGQLAKLNSSTESVKEMSFSLPSRVEIEEMINNVKDVICNHTSTTILTKNGLIFILGEYSSIADEKDQTQEIKQIWQKQQSQKDTNKQQQQQKQQEGSPKLTKKKQKNQIQYSWQTFVKVFTQGEWGGCALTKKGDIVFFNKFFQTEKLGGKSQFTDVFANREKMFALQSDCLLEWDFGFILKNGFFQNNKRTNIDRKLDVKFYPPKIHQFTQTVKQAKFVLSQNNSQVALNVETDGGDVFVEKNNIFSQNRQRNNSDLSNKLNSSYLLNASQNRLNNQSMFSNNLPRGLQSPTSFLGSSGEYRHNFFSPESSDVYQKFLAGGNNNNIASLQYNQGYLSQQSSSGKKSYLNFGINSYRNNNMNENLYKQNNLAGADFEKRINQEMRRLNQNTYIPQMQDKSIDYQGKRINSDESYMPEELQLPSRLKTLTDLHTQIGSHFRERVHEVQSTINKAAYNKRYGNSPLKNKYQNQETINPSRSKLRIESQKGYNQQGFDNDDYTRTRSKLMTAGEFDQKWKELNRKSQSKGKKIQTYKSSKDLNYFLQLIQSGKSHFDLFEKNQSTPPKGNRDASFFANTKYGYQSGNYSQENNNDWSPLAINREQYNQLKQQKASFLKQWQSAGNDKFKQDQVLRNNNQFIDNWMNFNNYYDNQNRSSSNLGNSYYDDPQTGSLLSKSRSNPFYQNFQQQIHANDKLSIFGGLGEGKNGGGFGRGASNNRQIGSHHRTNSQNLNQSISGLSGSQLNIGSNRNQLKQFQFIDANGMKINLHQNQPQKSKNNLNESVISGRSNNRILNDSIHAGSERKIRMQDNKNDFEKQWEALNKSRDKSREEYLNKSQKSNSKNNSFYSDQKPNRSRSNSNAGSQKNFINDRQNNSSIALPKQAVPSSFLGGLQDPTQRGQSYFDALKPINTEGLETNSVFSSKPHGLPKYNSNQSNNIKNPTSQSKNFVSYQGDNNFSLDFNQLGSHNNQSPRFHQNRNQYIQSSPERLNRSYDPNLSNSYQHFKSRKGSFGLESEEQDLQGQFLNKSSQSAIGNFPQNRSSSTEKKYKDLQSQFESQLSENQKLKELLKKQEEQDKRENRKTADRQKPKKDGNTILTEGSMNLSSSENEQGFDDNIDPSKLSKEELSKRKRKEERALQQQGFVRQNNRSIQDIDDEQEGQREDEEFGFEINNQQPQKMQKSLKEVQQGKNLSAKSSKSNIPQDNQKIKKIVGYDKYGKAIIEIIEEEEEEDDVKRNKSKKGEQDLLSEKIVGYDEEGIPIIEESAGKIVQKVIGQDENGKPIVIDVYEDHEDSLKKSKRKLLPGQENVIQKVVGFDQKGRPIIQEIILDEEGSQQNVNTRGFLSKDEINPEKLSKSIDKVEEQRSKQNSSDVPPNEIFQRVVGYDNQGKPIIDEVFIDEEGVMRSVKNTAAPKEVQEKIIGYDQKGKPIIEQIQAKIIQQVVGYDSAGNPIVEEVLQQQNDIGKSGQQAQRSQQIEKVVGYDKKGKPIIEETNGKILSKIVGYDKQGRPIVEEIFVDDEDLKRNTNKNQGGNDEDQQSRVIQKVVGYDDQNRPIIEKVVVDLNQEQQKPELIEIEQTVGYDKKGNPIIETKEAQITKQIIGYDNSGKPIIQDVLEFQEDVKKNRPGMDNSQTFSKIIGYNKDGKPIIEESKGRIVKTIVGYDKNGQPVVEEIFVDNNDLKAKKDGLNKQNSDRVVQKVVGYDKQGRPLIEKIVISQDESEPPKVQKMQKVIGYNENGDAIVKNTKAQISKQVVGYDNQGNPIIEEVLEEEQAVLNKKQGGDQSKAYEKVIGYDQNGKPIFEVSQGKIIQKVVGYDDKGRPIVYEVFIDNNDLKQNEDGNKNQSRIVQNVVGYDKEGRPLIEKVVVNDNEQEQPQIKIIQKIFGYDGKGKPIIENTKAQISKQIVGYDSQGNPIIEDVLEEENDIKKSKKGLDKGKTIEKIVGYDENGEPIVELSQGKIIQKIAGYDESGRPIIEEIFIDNKDLVQEKKNQPRVVQKVVGYDKEGRPLIEKVLDNNNQTEEPNIQRIQKVVGYDQNGKPITKNTVGQITKQIIGYDSQGNPIIEEVLQDEEDIQKRKPGFDNGEFFEKIIGQDSNGKPIVEKSQGKIIQKIAGYDEKGRPIIEEIFIDNKDLQQKENNLASFIDQGRVVQKVTGYDADGRPIIQKVVLFDDQQEQPQFQTLEKVVGVDENGKPVVEKVQGRITKQLVGYDSQGRPIVDEILEDIDDLKRKANQSQVIEKVVGYDKNGNPIIEQIQGKIVQKIVGYDDQGRAIVEEIIVDDEDTKRSRSKSNQKGRYVNKVDHYDDQGRPVVQKVFIGDQEANTAAIHATEKVVGLNEKGEPIIMRGNATITKQLIGYDNQGNKVFADVLVDDNKKDEQDQVKTIQKIVGFDKKGKPIVEQVLGKIVQQVVGYDDEGRPIIEEVLIDQDELKKSKKLKSQEGGRYVQKVVSYDDQGRPIIEKVLVNEDALTAVTPPHQVSEKIVGFDNNGDPIVVKNKVFISKQIVGYDSNGKPILEEILEDEEQIKRNANQQVQDIQVLQKVIGHDKNGEPITEDCIAKIVQKVVGYDDQGRPIVEKILIEESDLNRENKLNDSSVRVIQKVVGFDDQGRPIIEKVVVDNSDQQGQTVEKQVNKKIVYDQNGRPKLIVSSDGKITKQIVGYDDFGVPVIEEILEDQNTVSKQPQLLEKIIAQDKNGNPIIEQCFGKIVQQVVGYDKNGIPIIQEVLIDEEDIKKQDLAARGSASTSGRIMQKVVGYDNQGRPIIERIFIEQQDHKKSKQDKSDNFLLQDEEEIASDFVKKRQNASKNDSLNKSQPINFDLQDELENQLKKEIEDLSSRHSDLKKSQNLTYSSIDHNLSQSPEKKKNKEASILQKENEDEKKLQKEQILQKLQEQEMEEQSRQAELEQLQKIQQLEKQRNLEKQQQTIQRLTSQTPKSQKNNNSFRASQEVKQNKSNINLDNSRGSLNNSRNATPKSNSLRFSDICNSFNKQMKKTHLNEQTKGFERNTGLRVSQYADQNRSRNSINNSRGSMNNSNMQSKSPVNTKKSMFSPFPDNNKKNNNDILPEELKNQPYHNLKKSQESINKSFNEMSDPNFIKSPISPILPPTAQQKNQKTHFFGQAASIASAASPSNQSQTGYLKQLQPGINFSETNFDVMQQGGAFNNIGQGMKSPFLSPINMSSNNSVRPSFDIKQSQSPNSNTYKQQKPQNLSGVQNDLSPQEQKITQELSPSSKPPTGQQKYQNKNLRDSQNISPNQKRENEIFNQNFRDSQNLTQSPSLGSQNDKHFIIRQAVSQQVDQSVTSPQSFQTKDSQQNQKQISGNLLQQSQDQIQQQQQQQSKEALRQSGNQVDQYYHSSKQINKQYSQQDQSKSNKQSQDDKISQSKQSSQISDKSVRQQQPVDKSLSRDQSSPIQRQQANTESNYDQSGAINDKDSNSPNSAQMKLSGTYSLKKSGELKNFKQPAIDVNDCEQIQFEQTASQNKKQNKLAVPPIEPQKRHSFGIYESNSTDEHQSSRKTTEIQQSPVFNSNEQKIIFNQDDQVKGQEESDEENQKQQQSPKNKTQQEKSKENIIVSQKQQAKSSPSNTRQSNPSQDEIQQYEDEQVEEQQEMILAQKSSYNNNNNRFKQNREESFKQAQNVQNFIQQEEQTDEDNDQLKQNKKDSRSKSPHQSNTQVQQTRQSSSSINSNKTNQNKADLKQIERGRLNEEQNEVQRNQSPSSQSQNFYQSQNLSKQQSRENPIQNLSKQRSRESETKQTQNLSRSQSPSNDDQQFSIESSQQNKRENPIQSLNKQKSKEQASSKIQSLSNSKSPSNKSQQINKQFSSQDTRENPNQILNKQKSNQQQVNKDQNISRSKSPSNRNQQLSNQSSDDQDTRQNPNQIFNKQRSSEQVSSNIQNLSRSKSPSNQAQQIDKQFSSQNTRENLNKQKIDEQQNNKAQNISRSKSPQNDNQQLSKQQSSDEDTTENQIKNFNKQRSNEQISNKIQNISRSKSPLNESQQISKQLSSQNNRDNLNKQKSGEQQNNKTQNISRSKSPQNDNKQLSKQSSDEDTTENQIQNLNKQRSNQNQSNKTQNLSRSKSPSNQAQQIDKQFSSQNTRENLNKQKSEEQQNNKAQNISRSKSPQIDNQQLSKQSSDEDITENYIQNFNKQKSNEQVSNIQNLSNSKSPSNSSSQISKQLSSQNTRQSNKAQNISRSKSPQNDNLQLSKQSSDEDTTDNQNLNKQRSNEQISNNKNISRSKSPSNESQQISKQLSSQNTRENPQQILNKQKSNQQQKNKDQNISRSKSPSNDNQQLSKQSSDQDITENYISNFNKSNTQNLSNSKSPSNDSSQISKQLFSQNARENLNKQKSGEQLNNIAQNISRSKSPQNDDQQFSKQSSDEGTTENQIQNLNKQRSNEQSSNEIQNISRSKSPSNDSSQISKQLSSQNIRDNLNKQKSGEQQNNKTQNILRSKSPQNDNQQLSKQSSDEDTTENQNLNKQRSNVQISNNKNISRSKSPSNESQQISKQFSSQNTRENPQQILNKQKSNQQQRNKDQNISRSKSPSNDNQQLQKQSSDQNTTDNYIQNFNKQKSNEQGSNIQNLSNSKSPSNDNSQISKQLSTQITRENPNQILNKQISDEQQNNKAQNISRSKSPQNDNQQLSKQSSRQDTTQNQIENLNKQRSNEYQSNKIQNQSRSKSPTSNSQDNQKANAEKSSSITLNKQGDFQQQKQLENSQEEKTSTSQQFKTQLSKQDSKNSYKEINQQSNKQQEASEKETSQQLQSSKQDSKWKLADKKQDGKQSFEQFKKQLSQGSAQTPLSASSPTEKPKNFEDYQKQNLKREGSPLGQKKVQDSANQNFISREKQTSQLSRDQSPSQRIPSVVAENNASKNNTQENELIEQNQKLEKEGLIISDIIDTQDQIETNRNISARQIQRTDTQNSKQEASPYQRQVSPSINQNLSQEEQIKRRLSNNQQSKDSSDGKKQEEVISFQNYQNRNISPKQQSQNLHNQSYQPSNDNKLRDSELNWQQQVEQSQQGLKGKYTPKSNTSSSSPVNSFPNQTHSDSENQDKKYKDEPLSIQDLQQSQQQGQRNQDKLSKQGTDNTRSSQERQKKNLQVDSNLEQQNQSQIIISPNFQSGQTIQSPNFQQVQQIQQQIGNEILPQKQQFTQSGHIYEEDQQGNNDQSDLSSDNRLSPLQQKNKDLIKNTQNIPVDKQGSNFSNYSNQQSQNQIIHQKDPYQQLKQNRTGEFQQQNQIPQFQSSNRSSRSPSTSLVSPRQLAQQNVSPKIQTQQQSGQKSSAQSKTPQISSRGERINFSPRMSQEIIKEQKNVDSSFEEIHEILNEKREQVQQQQKNTERNRVTSIVSNMNNSSNNITQINPTGTQNTQNIPTVQTSHSPPNLHQGSQNYNIYTQQQQDAISPRLQQNSQQSINQRTSRGNSQTSLPQIPPEIQDEKYRVLRESALGSIIQKKEERDNQVLNLVKNSGYSSPNPSFHQQKKEEELKQQQSQNLNRQFDGEEESNSDQLSNLKNSLNLQSIYSTGLLKQTSPSRKASNSLSLQQQQQQILNESELTGNVMNFSNNTGGFDNLSQSQSGVNNQNAALAKEIMRRSANLRDQEKLIHKDKDKFLQKNSRSNSQNSNSIHQSLQAPQQNNAVFNSQVGQVSAILDERSQISGTAFMGSQSIPFNDNSSVFANQDNLQSQNLKNSQNQQFIQHPLQQAIQNIGSMVERQEYQEDNNNNNFTTLTQSGNKQTIPRVHSRNVSRTNVTQENDQIQGNDSSSLNEQEEVDPTNIYQAYRMKNPRSSSNIGQNISPRDYVEHANMNQAIQEQQYIEKVQTIAEEQKRLQNQKQSDQIQQNQGALPGLLQSNNQIQDNQQRQNEQQQINYEDESSDDEDLNKEFSSLEEAQQAVLRKFQRKEERDQRRRQNTQQQGKQSVDLFQCGNYERIVAGKNDISKKEHEEWLRKQEAIEIEEYKQKQKLEQQNLNRQKTPQQQLFDKQDDQLEKLLHQQAETYLQETYGDKLNFNQKNNQNQEKSNKKQDKSLNSQNTLSNQVLGSDQKSSSLQVSQSQNKTSSEITFLNSNSGHKDDKEIQSATFPFSSNNQQFSSPKQQQNTQNLQQNQAVPTFGDQESSSQISTSRQNSFNQAMNENKFKQDDIASPSVQRDFNRKNNQQPEQFIQNNESQQKKHQKAEEQDEDFIYLSNSNQIKKSPPGSIYQIIEKQKQDIEQNKQQQELNKKPSLLPLQHGQKLSFQDYKNQQNPTQQQRFSPTFNQVSQDEMDENNNKKIGSQNNYIHSASTSQFNNPTSLQNSQLGFDPEQVHSNDDPQYDLDAFRVKPNQNPHKQRQEAYRQEFGRESFGNNNFADMLSDEQIMQNFNENIAPKMMTKSQPPNSNSSRNKTIAQEINQTYNFNQAYEESSEAHNTSYYSQHFQKTEESLDDNSIQNYSQFRPFYDKNQGDESGAININYTPDKQNASRTQFSTNQFQTSYYQSPSMNLSRGYKQASLDPAQLQGNRLQFEQLVASQRAQTDRNLTHSVNLNDNKTKGFQSDRNENEHKSFGDYRKQKSRDQVIQELYNKEVNQMQQNALKKIQDHREDLTQSFSKSKGSQTQNPFLKSSSSQKDISVLDRSAFNKLSSEKQICVVIAMKLENFQLKRKFQAFQNLKIKTHMASKRESFSNMQFRQKQQIAKVIYQTLSNNLKRQYLDFFIRLRKNLILQNVNIRQYSSPSQQKISSQELIDFSSLTRKQQILYHSVGHFSKTINKLKQGRLRQAFDQILYSNSSLRPTIDQNQFFLSQRNQNMRQPVFYTDGNEEPNPQTPERKSRQLQNNKGLQRATSDSPERLAKIQQQVRNSQKNNSLKQPIQLHKMNEGSQQYSQDRNQSFSENQQNNEPFDYNNNRQSQQLVNQIENMLYFSKKTTDSQTSVRQINNLNDHSKGYKFQMNEFESNLESPNDRNTDDNEYRPQFAPTYADPKEFQPDIQYLRNLSQDDLLLFEELQKNNSANNNNNNNLLRPLAGSQYQLKNQSHGSRMDYSDFDQNSQQNEQEKHQFEKYLNQFNLSMSQNQSISHTPYQQPYQSGNLRNSASLKQQNQQNLYNLQIADYQFDDDNSLNQGEHHHHSYNQQMQHSYTMPTTEQMKLLNQSQQYAFIPESLQPGYMHKYANKLLKIPAIVNYADVRSSMTGEKKMNEQSLVNPPAQHLPGYEKVINAQKQAIAKSFKKLHNEKVTGKEISINTNQSQVMNNTSVLSPTQRGLMSSQSMYITNLNQSSYQSPRQSMVAMNASNRLYGIAVQKQQQQQQQQNQQQQSSATGSKRLISPDNKSYSLKRSGGQFN